MMTAADACKGSRERATTPRIVLTDFTLLSFDARVLETQPLANFEPWLKRWDRLAKRKKWRADVPAKSLARQIFISSEGPFGYCPSLAAVRPDHRQVRAEAGPLDHRQGRPVPRNRSCTPLASCRCPSASCGTPGTSWLGRPSRRRAGCRGSASAR